MNDFTKEELLYIHNYIFNGAASIRIDKHDELRDKIQSMIDNYCEHKNDVWPLYTSTGDLPSAGLCYECNCPVYREFINE